MQTWEPWSDAAVCGVLFRSSLFASFPFIAGPTLTVDARDSNWQPLNY